MMESIVTSPVGHAMAADRLDEWLKQVPRAVHTVFKAQTIEK